MSLPRKRWITGFGLSLVAVLVPVVGIAYVLVGSLGVYGCSSRDYARADHLAADKALIALTGAYAEAPKVHTGCDDDDGIASAHLELHVGLPGRAGSREIEATLIEHGWRRVDYQPDGAAYLASCLTKRIDGQAAEAGVSHDSEDRADQSSDFQVSVASPPWTTCGEPVDTSCSRPTSLEDLRHRAEPSIYVPARSKPRGMSTCGQMASLDVDGFQMSFDAHPMTDPVHCRVAELASEGARQEEVAGRPVFVEGDVASIQFFVGATSIEIDGNRREASVGDVLAFARRLPLPPADPNPAPAAPCAP